MPETPGTPAGADGYAVGVSKKSKIQAETGGDESASTANAEVSFEAALAEVESIIERIESGEVGLEQSLTQYQRGVELINHCRQVLGRASQTIEELGKKLEKNDGAGE